MLIVVMSALNMSMKSVSIELEPAGILVMSMHPGWVETDKGGPNGMITVDECVSTMVKTISQLGEKDNGSFLRYNNTSIPCEKPNYKFKEQYYYYEENTYWWGGKMTSWRTPAEMRRSHAQKGRGRDEFSCNQVEDTSDEEMSPEDQEILRRNIVKQRIQYFDRQTSKQKSIDSGKKILSIFIMERGKNEEEENTDFGSSQKVAKIAREIMTSEEAYVNNLKLLNVDFRAFVSKEIDDAIPPCELNKILSYFPELQLLNSDLLNDFTSRIRNWDSNPKIADIMVIKGKFLLIYASYIKEFPRNSQFYQECLKKYPKFRELVLAFQLKKECRNLKIEHLMLEPIQRLPRYKLLFERYVKNLPVGDPDYEVSLEALEIILKIADKANTELKEYDEFKKMLNLQSRVNESDLIQPDRELFKEGELLKISRNSVDPRYIVLLSDILLYTTSYSILAGDPANTNLRIHYKIPLIKLKVDDLADEIDAEETDFQIISSVRSFVLRANSLEEKIEWMKAINDAATSLRTKRSTFDLQKSKEIPEEEEKEIILGETAPVWIPDKKVSMCQKYNRAPLKYLNYKSDRVCDECFDSIKEEYYYQDAKANSQYLSLFRKREEHKSGKRVVKSGKWKKSWFVLKDNVLYAYKASSDTVAIDTFPVLGLEVEVISEKIEDLNNEPNGSSVVFQLIHAGLQKYSLCFKNRE
ncbi:FGD5_6 [Lepeophtheirus salmonis]|uniref:FGD5_6 n=1 Tax=Lepeophtheirus salmonis TaxID=72036 RepID=A0A7R8CIG1_LEPSM|nr:FGD5_6 [Lepeophtheirus salmonis]CAF2826640.1 FGD5_6 [Lepeophtheirus salmonis]